MRRLLFPFLRKLNFRMRIKHHFTQRYFHLKFWDHKGYWYYGSRREKNEIRSFQAYINAGDCVLEIGGHIGYLTQIFEDCVGESGRVFVVEPTPDSLNFLLMNKNRETTVFNCALSDKNGIGELFTEQFGGFTNSIDENFIRERVNIFESSQHRKNSEIKKLSVETKTLDSLCIENKIKPNFIKLDIEGAEWLVLQQGTNTLQAVDWIMIEVSKNVKEVFNFMYSHSFLAFNPDGSPVKPGVFKKGNVFFQNQHVK